MIKVRVVTEISFKCEHDLNEYLDGDEQARITGFSREIREAWRTKTPLQVTTPRPNIGAITESTIAVIE